MVAAGGGGIYYTTENGAESCNGGYGGALTGGNGTKQSNSATGKARAVIDGENGQKGYFTKK
jgi:hypothetical protein